MCVGLALLHGGASASAKLAAFFALAFHDITSFFFLFEGGGP